ncbi:MAG: hypothetical protein EP329_18245 [Deltaproteobacteria bacterium]|nr:MAG: hypothetical protein EP329_18245 [Deltaproteobacteria bacterium]
MARRILIALAALAALAGCETEFPGTAPPGACAAGDKICFHEPNSGRNYVLRCNVDEVEGAIWLIDDVCVEQQVCEVDRCVEPSP